MKNNVFKNLTMQMLEIEVQKRKQLLYFMFTVAIIIFICGIIVVVKDGFSDSKWVIFAVFPILVFSSRKNYLDAKNELENRKKQE